MQLEFRLNANCSDFAKPFTCPLNGKKPRQHAICQRTLYDDGYYDLPRPNTLHDSLLPPFLRLLTVSCPKTIRRYPRIYINARVAEKGLSASRLDRAHRGRACRRGRGCSGYAGRRNGHRRGGWSARRAKRREAAPRQAACGRARECAVRPTSAAPGRE